MIKSKLTGKDLTTPLYKSSTNISISSLSKITQYPTIVYFEEETGHLQTKEMEGVENYYDKEYEFYNQSEEDDILYKVEGDKKIYRQQHQVETILSKIDIKPAMKILDYGCAKGTVMKRLLERRKDIKTYLFDVSRMYENLWKKFVNQDQYSSYQVRPEWNGQMDVVTSFFAFEHVVDPIKELQAIKKLLKENGLVYIIVPNVFENYNDFIVSDHIHHYSQNSLRYLLSKAGFEVLEIDSNSHFGAFIAIGKKVNVNSLPFDPNPNDLKKVKEECEKIANYWSQLQNKIIAFENENSGGKAAIYGAGVYGNFIATSLKKLNYVSCFIDQNELLYNEKILNKPVYSPKNLPEDVTLVYVGVNPKIAKNVINDIESWKNRKIQFMFL
jgi:cyclopropane fatty-acyl-phospholipid synthase-like methyltransferase